MPSLDLFLELYEGEIPDFFRHLPGVGIYEDTKRKYDHVYWGVVIKEPTANNNMENYLKSLPISGTASHSHGTDMIPEANTINIMTEELGIWSPLSPPYEFDVYSPSVSSLPFYLSPAPGSDDNDWHTDQIVPTRAVGIWSVVVKSVGSDLENLPLIQFDGCNADFNPDIPIQEIQSNESKQPMLKINVDYQVVPEECNGDLLGLEILDGCAPGRVKFKAIIENKDSLFAITWSFGNHNRDDQQFLDDQIQNNEGIVVEHVFDEEEARVAIVTILRPPLGCRENLTDAMTITVPLCEQNCPSIKSVKIVGSGCAPGEVDFKAKIGNLENVDRINWYFGDETSASYLSDNIHNGLEVSHMYSSSGNFQVTVIIESSIDCDPQGFHSDPPLQVPRCQNTCPEITNVQIMDGCAAGEVAFEATIENIELVEALIWNFGDGSQASYEADDIESGLQVMHHYDATRSFLVTVTILRPDGCDSKVFEFDPPVQVPRCPKPLPQLPPPQDDPTDSDFNLCTILRFLALLGFGLFSVGLVLFLCPSFSAGTGLVQYISSGALMGAGATIAIVSFIIWLVICEPTLCKVIVFIWQAIIILGGLMVYAILCPACFWMILGIVVIGAGLAGFYIWVEKCSPTTCSIYWELLFLFIVYDICQILEYAMGFCAMTSHPILSLFWTLVPIVVSAYLYYLLEQKKCIKKQA
ncbi:MAG: hypothetical protein GY710_15290 [Desulfobacteraceae bacterium]|nr:hypothetical protein [Desulfobacteraceae bacterium]